MAFYFGVALDSALEGDGFMEVRSDKRQKMVYRIFDSQYAWHFGNSLFVRFEQEKVGVTKNNRLKFMTKNQKIFLFLSRVFLGGLFFYAGITKVLNPDWSAAGYLKSAKTFGGFYTWLAGPDILPITNFLNEWGLTLIGAALVLGVFVRLSSVLGAFLMILYYFPGLEFPYVEHGFLVTRQFCWCSLVSGLGAFGD